MTICDSHIHIVGDLARHKQVADRTYTAGPATLAQLEHHAARLGVGRFVVVQPSFYGADNSVLIGALAALDGRGRGVAVIDPASIGQSELSGLAASGVCGLRINLYSTLAGTRGDALGRSFAETAAIAQRQGWHVEVIAPIAMLAEASALLARSPVPVVIDHYGLHQGAAPNSEAGGALLGLLRLPHVWMKLSAPYRCSGDPLATRPDAAWLTAILGACRERCVWGSDWPHTRQTGGGVPLPYRVLDYAAVLADFQASLPPGRPADDILRHNPARLYGFT